MEKDNVYVLFEEIKNKIEMINGKLEQKTGTSTGRQPEEVIPTCVRHIHRHTFATTVTLANNVPLQEVSAMLGHASTRMTQHYARVMDRNLKDNMNIVRSKMGL